jgi:dCTP deaminase
MILSNVEIIAAIKYGGIFITPFPDGMLPKKPPFNTSSVDLRLGDKITIPNHAPVALRPEDIGKYLETNSKELTISRNQAFLLRPKQFVLAKNQEWVGFPIWQNRVCYSARVEGKSSIARCGVLVHFTAPTIHAGWEGNITVEIINLGSNDVLLDPDMYICQLIIEEVKGTPIITPSKFRGQTTPAGS